VTVKKCGKDIFGLEIYSDKSHIYSGATAGLNQMFACRHKLADPDPYGPGSLLYFVALDS